MSVKPERLEEANREVGQFDLYIEDLFEYLAHGDDDHREWLFEALVSFFLQEERPPQK